MKTVKPVRICVCCPTLPEIPNVLSRWIRGFADQRHRDFMCLEAELRRARISQTHEMTRLRHLINDQPFENTAKLMDWANQPSTKPEASDADDEDGTQPRGALANPVSMTPTLSRA
jgi:hypothetical protein